MTTKTCIQCNNEYPINNFYVQKHKRRSGIKIYYSSYCKKCDREKAKRVKSTEEYRKKQNAKRALRCKTDPQYVRKNRIRHRNWHENNYSKVMLSRARYRAKKKGLEFDLTLDDIVVPSKCPLLECEFVIGTKGDYLYSPTIDRLDSSKGYTKDNIRVISMLANSMKNTASNAELILFAKNIITYIADDIVRTTENDNL